MTPKPRPPIDPRLQELGRRIGLWIGVLVVVLCLLAGFLLICWNLGPASYFHLPAMSFPEALGFSGLLLGMLGVLLLLRGTDS
jgi:hypothetical protein